MSPRLTTRVGASAGTVLVTLVVAACGSTTSHYVPLTAANISAQMVAAVQGKHSAHEVTASVGTTAIVDFDTSGTLRYRIESTAGSTVQTLIGIGPDIYLQTSKATTAKWLKAAASVAGSTVTAASINPVTMVTAFNKGLKNFTYIGATTIDGAQVQHYQVTVDQAQYQQSLGQGTGSANLGADEPVVEDLYLNRDNTLRRVLIAMPAGVGNVQLDVTKWGEPVTISAPPASDVTLAQTVTPTATPTANPTAPPSKSP